jgi:DNA-binding GntR family transcriptional regulator
MIDDNSPVSLHKQLAAILRERIRSGDLAGRIPSILTLAQQYEVGHNTAYRALVTLRDEGLIVSARGRGYYVAG